jgi:hypothetical protein
VQGRQIFASATLAITERTWPSLYKQLEQGELIRTRHGQRVVDPGLASNRPSGQGRFVRTETDDEERTRLGRSDLHMLFKHGGFMPNRADDKEKKLAETPQAV